MPHQHRPIVDLINGIIPVPPQIQNIPQPLHHIQHILVRQSFPIVSAWVHRFHSNHTFPAPLVVDLVWVVVNIEPAVAFY